MAAISWKSSVSGNWTVAADWSTGAVPTLSGDVTIAAPFSYTVTVSSNGVIVHPIGGLQADAIPFGVPDEANSLTFDAQEATLQENAGTLDVAEALTVSAGLVSLNEANTIGNVAIEGGTLAFGNGGALGAGPVSLSGGELLATANETLSNEFILSGSSTIAAADGTTLTETGFTSFSANSTLNFGAFRQDGVIIWNPGTASINVPVTLNVVAGTLKAGGIILAATISDGARPTTVAAGATLDLGGFGLSLTDLLGGGAVIDSGAAATLTLAAANFSGTISGALSLIFNGATTLSGLEDYTGDATLDGAITVANAGTYDLVANTNITGSAGSSGVIHGRVMQSGGVTTVSALVPSDFNEDGTSDILWQNAGGQASIWDMTANTLTGGGPVSPNPGPAWKAIGTGHFNNGDDRADILWQNADGRASIWDMNGNIPIDGGPVSPNPGPAWQAIGTGDFNGDGLSDILFQSTSSGQVSIWEMNGNKLIGGGPVSPNPGTAWKAIGTGDFNGDGDSDILFQNASSGQVSIWEMKGNTLIGGGPVSPDPGPAWKAIGTGDFNGDGRSDILFQNTSSGQVSIWEMNGNTLTGGGPVSPNPGPSWHAVGTGDFNGDGHSDILFQNASGQASVWEMNGNSLIGGGAAGANPGASWRAVV
jgi:FG-GAP-like repeat